MRNRDRPDYAAVHQWARKFLGTPMRCEECGDGTLRRRQYHWANLSGTYLRIPSDWKRLCVKCHFKIDKGFSEDACLYGHERTTENTYVKSNGDKECHPCRKRHNLEYYYRKKEKIK